MSFEVEPRKHSTLGICDVDMLPEAAKPDVRNVSAYSVFNQRTFQLTDRWKFSW
jgi:hypothetical protein